MFQTFDAPTSPDQGPPRLAALRTAMDKAGVAAFLVPRADRFQGEYVAPSDERLAWLTGFTGSAGFAAVTFDRAGVFVDGRYRVQVRAQVADVFTPVNWPETKLGPWLAQQLPEGATIGFDPWLHTKDEVEAIRKAIGNTRRLVPTQNLIDAIWTDRPSPPIGAARAHPIEFAGERSVDKRNRLAKVLSDAGQSAAVITLPDSICWLLNIRGGDIPRNPVVHAFAILSNDGRVSLFSEPAKFASLAPDDALDIQPWDAFEDSLRALKGRVRVDRSTAPVAVSQTLNDAGIEVAWGDDPCSLPKACKNEAELQGMRDAHMTDAVAMIEFLAWLDREAPKGTLTEISAAQKLEDLRRVANALQDISFDTISGAGPNGAIIHYRVTEDTNRPLQSGELYLVDSGGQYLNGTTDITRTIAIGPPTSDQCACYTRVLQGMIAISLARFPKGIAGRDLDALARQSLWRAGQDYDHGTGHGVGAYLSVHEGPQRLSRMSEVPLKPGMILSNEPGYYREGAFGIRLENLIVVQEAAAMGDNRDHYDFETLTFVPLDTRLIAVDMLAPWEAAWVDRYHSDVRDRLSGRISEDASTWLEAATRPLQSQDQFSPSGM
ncbi:MAG: aminopeptidase P family protein [Pseudomonadota bacterium]